MTSTGGVPRGRRLLVAPAAVLLAALLLVLAFQPSWRSALGVALGPLAGGYARHWQSCCTENSLAILPWSAGALALGVLVRLATHPQRKATRLLQVSFWVLGWVAWFGGALLSYAHALE